MKLGTPVQPSLEALMAGYLRRQAEAAELGLAPADGPEVTPYEAGPVQPIDAKLAWEESLAALSYWNKPVRGLKAPTGWANLVAQLEPQVAIAFCVGNYPQLVRDFHKLLSQPNLTSLRPVSTTPIHVPPLAEWGEKASGFPQTLLALAAFRLTRNFQRANELMELTVPAQWQSPWENERAALLWHQGKSQEALAIWQHLTPTLPIRFNIAMAKLFTGHGRDAKADFEATMAQLPTSSAWHHLARLYHTLCVLRP